MKTITKSILTLTGMVVGLLNCSAPELPTPNTFSSGATYKAYFNFANATTDAASLDFYVNGIKLGAASPGVGSTGPTAVQIPTPGTTGGVTANTSIRTKATSGTIGGRLGAADLLFRSSANGTGIFSAVNTSNYTVIAIDSLGRSTPPRLSRNTATISFADLTYWNPNTNAFISASRRDSLNPVNCPACVNWDGAAQTPSTATEYANIVPVGTGTGLVPLGITDPGGIRYLVITDALLTFTAATVVTNAGIRFINGIANSNNITAAANANGTFGGPPVYARLNGGGPNLTNTGAPNATNAFVGSVASSTAGPPSNLFNPTVGSRIGNGAAGGLFAFTPQTVAVAGVPNAYTLQIATDGAFTNIVYSAPVSLVPGKNYTIFVRGKFDTLTGIQPKISHGIITH